MTGSLSSSPRRARGLQLSVRIPCSAWKARSAACGKYGCSSTWLTAGTTPVSSMRRVSMGSVKLDTPTEPTRPSSRSAIMARNVST